MPSLDENDEVALGLAAITVVKPKAQAEDLVPGSLQLFVIVNGAFSTHPLPDTGTVAIGRSGTSDIVIRDDSISRKHAVLHLGDAVTIEDLDSANGTVVRGSKAEPQRPTAITVGELVVLGNASLILQRTRPARPRRVWTRDHFEARLVEECARVQRSGAGFVLLRVRSLGEAPPNFVEGALDALLRDSDILGKFGTNEHEVLLTDTAMLYADEAVRRIDGKLRERGIECKLFVACCPSDGKTPQELRMRLLDRSNTKAKPAAPAADIVVSDPQMQSLYRLVEQIAVSDISVLLLGETGVGKEVFSRAVHRGSPRAAGPFVELNCAALTEPLLESELFGHEKGAFTNAIAAKPGLIELAHGGTMFLDEIGDMPLSTQVKLLRVIEDCQLRRVGGLKARPIDVRFVAATNSDIEAQVARGAFRSDLYFRLNGVTIMIPPLRERLGELEALARAFISRARSREARPTLAPEAIEVLRSYSWPGNVRELKNVIERAVLLCGTGPIQAEHLSIKRVAKGSVGIFALDKQSTATQLAPSPESSGSFPTRPRKGSEEEHQWIMRALEQTNGNQTLAARLLGISRRTLVNRLGEYGHTTGRPRKL
ncbi:MAG: sigma 54-interacting transcriptional regulator, partial [Kofleriaceae bacterium]